MTYDILDSTWWSPANMSSGFVQGLDYKLCIGAVAVKTKEGKLKAYIGYGTGILEDADAQSIAQHGAKLIESEARGIFPQFKDMEFAP